MSPTEKIQRVLGCNAAAEAVAAAGIRARHGDLSERELRLRQAAPAGRELFVASAEDTVLQKLLGYRLGNEVSDAHAVPQAQVPLPDRRRPNATGPLPRGTTDPSTVK